MCNYNILRSISLSKIILHLLWSIILILKKSLIWNIHVDYIIIMLLNLLVNNILALVKPS